MRGLYKRAHRTMSPQKNHTKMIAEVSKVPPLPVGRVDLLYEHPFRGSEDQAH